MAPFLLVFCQPGFEKPLKKEVEALFPEARFSFSRPGLVTFKRLNGEWTLENTLTQFAWGRVVALSGKIESFDFQKQTLQGSSNYQSQENRVSVFPRDSNEVNNFSDEAKALIRAIDSPLEHLLIQVDPEKWILGIRKTSNRDWPLPGGFLFPPSEVENKPASIPSRAYYKMKEALWRSGFKLTSDMLAVEVGSAPGGATLALLESGIQVLGVDPGKMSDELLQNSRFNWLAKPILEVIEAEVPEKVALWVLDINVAPQSALSAIEPWVRKLRRPTLGIIFTLKMNEPSFMDQLDRFKTRIEDWGIRSIKIEHLPSNRNEVCLWGRSTRSY